MNLLWLLPLAAAISAVLTGGVRRYAMAFGVLDLPNERSSHTVPTPRGGGVAIVVSFLTSAIFLLVLGVIDTAVATALIGSGVLVAVIGFIDDHSPIAVHWRLVAHLCAAAWALGWLGGLPPLVLAGTSLDFGWIGNVLAAIWLVWLLNLYNFMDGIDGIAGLEAVTVGFGATLLYLQRSTIGHEWLLPALLAMAALGFLLWNWPPARIFMGDAGSGFLGLMLGIMSIRAAWLDSELMWSWVILLGVFVVDATVTLVRRLQRDKKPYEGHRDHAYQHAASQRIAHRTVTLAIGAINLFWLFPVAVTVNLGLINGLAGVVLGYAPLVWLAIRFQAGALSSDYVRVP